MKLNEMIRNYNPKIIRKVSKRFQNGLEYYITGEPLVIKDNLEVVKVIAVDNAYLFVVCPRCGQIHMYNIMQVRKNNHVVHGNCKGRLLFCGEITDLMEQQDPFIIDESGY
ncbi:hypothetical protein F8154_08900 [Alkaliphilus pronyensis]|uniref:Uncharacterized protein n=1 Tax=Alkaliphilus pronyensis TaxID=1482732 RepID=A0A6I0FAN6_9FIRM|nr:hypothetical protein [Alkaliphilus pronyensis]KAB3534412.1 hypothetical protein F8154_08900 [Alkaliphilus pronyensis]